MIGIFTIGSAHNKLPAKASAHCILPGIPSIAASVPRAQRHCIVFSSQAVILEVLLVIPLSVFLIPSQVAISATEFLNLKQARQYFHCGLRTYSSLRAIRTLTNE